MLRDLCMLKSNFNVHTAVSAGSAAPVAKPLPPKTDTDEAVPRRGAEVAELPNTHFRGASCSGGLDHHHA